MHDVRVEEIVVHRDPRGALVKLLPTAVPGEVYSTTAEPGASRGHHYHREMGEWFTALSGTGHLVLEDPRTGERAHHDLTGRRVYVPAGIAHALFATGDTPFVVLACADRLHDPGDVFPYPIQAP